MDFSGRTYDELYYELLLRGEQRKDLSLRQAKRLLSTLSDKPTVQLVLNSEAKLSLLTELVNDFRGTETDPHLEPLESRIGHLRHRTLRIADEKLSAQTKSLLSAIDAMEEALVIKVWDNARSLRSTGVPTATHSSYSTSITKSTGAADHRSSARPEFRRYTREPSPHRSGTTCHHSEMSPMQTEDGKRKTRTLKNRQLVRAQPKSVQITDPE
ncbi:hypothetical protein CBL_20665 [Carabus blaptoides fortunei]